MSSPADGAGTRRPDEIDLGDGRVIVLRQGPPAGFAGGSAPGEPTPGVPSPRGQRHPGPRHPWPLVLFLLTVACTFVIGGATESGFDWRSGLLQSGGIMTILLCHELGHFLQARRYGVPASLPIFLPMPPPFSLAGTLGAVIVMRPRTARTREMFDIAISGPLAGLVPTVACLLIGLPQSTLVPIKAAADAAAGSRIELGEPLVIRWLVQAFFDLPPGQTLMLGPLAFAGWFGLLITALNLLPVGQLDGGHVMYTLLRKHAFHVSVVVLLVAALGMIVANYWTWTIMIALLLFFGVRHPPLADDPIADDLGLPRKVLGWLTLVVSALLFLTPMPLQMSNP